MAEVNRNEHRSYAIVSKTTGKVLRRLTCSIADSEIQELATDEEIVPASSLLELSISKGDNNG